jgi:hypothetical protein
MIRIESLAIKEFRGIRDLTLDLKGKNYAVCGPNGTGKSGVVDALEFVLTGNISRLSGEGKGEISIKQHGPHVDSIDYPDRACVAVRISIPSLRKTVTVERNVKTPDKPTITPNDPDILAVLKRVMAHSEIVLSRRELIRYVLATPGNRAEEVQALLHLEQVEKVRGNLQKIANNCDKQQVPIAATVAQAQDSLLRAMGITSPTAGQVLKSVNTQRLILGLSELSDFSEITNLKDGMDVPGPVKQQNLSKVQILTDIDTARKLITEIASETIKNLIAEVTADISSLVDDPAVSQSTKQEAFFVAGFQIIVDDSCPFCDTSWDIVELKKHVKTKIDHLKNVSRKRDDIERKLIPFITLLSKLQLSIDALVRYGPLMALPIDMQEARIYSSACKTSSQQLTNLLPLSETVTTLSNIAVVPQVVIDVITMLEKTAADLPDMSKKDAAREWLTIAQERLQVWRDANRRQETSKKQALCARQVYDIYVSASDKVLTGIYTEVEQQFASLYRFANRDDEDKFKAQLIPSMGKLGFNVDFYGRGLFPPGAYHSEGHQDNMGLCLYLALMKYMQGDNFTFAVLDDVLMSVDSAHRREVCTVLKTEFPNTQFVMTTHDPIWLRHMKTEGLIVGRAAVQFRNWTVDHGPTLWDDRDVWSEIDDYLKANDVRAAAALLRHYLEHISAELCHRLRVPVEFRGDAQYQLGELMPPAIKHMRSLYTRAKEAGNSWNQKEIIEQVSEREKKFIALAETSKVEQWQVNAAVHFNIWDNLCKEDFIPVVRAFRELLTDFTCPDCNALYRVSPDRETPESVRCECGKMNINLRKKIV